MNDHAPFTARTASIAGGRRDGPSPLMAPRVGASGSASRTPADIPAQGVAWPVRAGAVPPLAAAFTVRTDSVPRIEALLEPGAAVALVPVPEGAGDAAGWLRSCGKTQLAAYLAEALWQSRGVELLAWVNASTGPRSCPGTPRPPRGWDWMTAATPSRSRPGSWAGWAARPGRGWWSWTTCGTRRTWTACCRGVPPAGCWSPPRTPRRLRAGAGGQVPVPAFSPREAMAYLFDRLTTDPDQRSGAYDLAEDLGGEPAALAQAGAVMAGSDTGCRNYQRYFAGQRERLRAAAGREPPAAAAVTWMLSAEYAEELLPGGGTWPLLRARRAAGQPRDSPCRARPARPPAGTSPTPATPSPDPQHAQSALAALEHAGLVCAGPAVHVSRPLQRAARAAAPAELLERAVRAAADAVLETWPDDQPRSGLAAQLRACAASLLRHAGDALWDGGSCHRVLLAAGQSLAAAAAHRPGGHLVAGGVRPLRAAARPRPSRHAGRGRAARPTRCWPPGSTPTPCSARGGSATAGTACSAPATRLPSPPGSASAGRWRPPANAGEALHGPAGRRRAQRAGPRPRRPGSPGRPATSTPPRSSRPATPPPRCASASGRWPAASRLHGPADPATLAAALRLAAACLAHGKAKDAIGQYKRVLAAREQALGPDHPDTLDGAGQPGRRLRHGRADRRRAARAPAGLRGLRARARPRSPPHPGPPRRPGPRLLRGRADRRRPRRAARQHQPRRARPCPRPTRSPAGCGRSQDGITADLAGE